MKGIRALVTAGLVLGVFGCSSEDGDATLAGAPKAPRMEEAIKMAGSLHVTWVNEEPACDGVELERRTTSPAGQVVADFAVVYRLPGAVDNKHDGTATEDATYTYRARCVKAGQTSAYSNEISANPK